MDTQQVINVIVTACIVIFSVFGNCLVVASVAKFEWLKTATNYFVAMLAFYDFCNGLPIFTVQLIMSGINEAKENITDGYGTSCKVYAFLAAFSGFGNLLCIIIVTIDRYLFINWPFRYHGIVTNSKAFVVAAVSFFSVLVVSIMGIYKQSATKPCSTFQMYNPYVVNYIGLPTSVSAVILVILLYGKIAWITWKNRKSHPSEMAGSDESGSQRKITKIISLVIGVFLMTYLVYFAAFLGTNGVKAKYVRWIQVVAIWIWRVSTVFNSSVLNRSKAARICEKSTIPLLAQSFINNFAF